MRNACDLNGNSHANTRCTNEDYWRLIKIPLPILTQKYVKFPNHNVTINQFCYIYLWQTSTIFMFGFGTHELSPFDFRHCTRNSSQNYALHAKGLYKANITKSTKSIIILLLITLLSSSHQVLSRLTWICFTVAIAANASMTASHIRSRWLRSWRLCLFFEK